MISVITPCFNSAKYVPQCVECVARQFIDGYEHIFMDGGSTDGTLEILADYQKSFSHIKIISKVDSGQSQAMNRGIREAKHNLIGFLNVDDSYLPSTLKIVYEISRNVPDYSFIVGNCSLVSSSGTLLSINKPTRITFLCLLLSSRLFPYPSNPSAYFYDRRLHNLVGYYSEDLHYTMDLEFILRMSRFANVIKIERVLGRFVLHTNSKTVKDQLKAQIERREWQSKYVNDLNPVTFVFYKVLRVFLALHESCYRLYSLSRRVLLRFRQTVTR